MSAKVVILSYYARCINKRFRKFFSIQNQSAFKSF